MLLLEPVNSIISNISTPPPSKKIKNKNHTSLSFRLTSFVPCFSEYEWERVSKDSCFALLWLTWSRRVVQTDRHGNYLGVAVLLFLNVSARWGGERRGIAALPTLPGNLPPCVCMEGQKEETVTCTFKLNLLFLVSLFFLTHPFILDSCEESHMMPSFNLSSKEFLAH